MKSSYELILRRARKEIRQNPLKKGDSILILDDNSGKAKLCMEIVKDIVKALSVKISISKKALSKKSRIILANSLEDECEELMMMLFEKTKPKKRPKSAIKLLRGIKEDEIAQIAKSKKIRIKKPKKTKIRSMLESLEKKYPGYKFSLLNAKKELENLPKK